MVFFVLFIMLGMGLVYSTRYDDSLRGEDPDAATVGQEAGPTDGGDTPDGAAAEFLLSYAHLLLAGVVSASSIAIENQLGSLRAQRKMEGRIVGRGYEEGADKGLGLTVLEWGVWRSLDHASSSVATM